jgi:chorismate mutase/prephenate dehydratase
VSDEIQRQRALIDALDERIVSLLNERAGLAQAIGSLKSGLGVYAPQREAQVLDHVSLLGNGPLDSQALRKIYTEVISACRALEKRMTVAYLGPEGTFSEMAVQKRFGSSVEGLPGASIDEVFRQGESGLATYSVVPIENSTEGAVGRTMDLLVATSLQICGEVVLRVRQNLMASRQEPPSSFTHVYSHPQSLGQCAGWLLQNLPAAKQIPVASNADAARRVVDEPTACAIGPELAAQRYGLHILAAGIEDDSRNMTRFLILGPGKTPSSGNDRTSLVMSAPNKPGAVLELISPFAQSSVSMTRIESRPARTGQWEYLFFIDVEGHQDDEPLRNALNQVRAKAPFLKILGSYPAAQL